MPPRKMPRPADDDPMGFDAGPPVPVRSPIDWDAVVERLELGTYNAMQAVKVHCALHADPPSEWERLYQQILDGRRE